MQRYSVFSLVAGALTRHRRWAHAWRSPEPRKAYDVLIVGAGGHGLATAYFLAKKHGIRNVAVLEKGYLGGGNTGRNTQVTRSNYFWPQSAAFFEHSLRHYETLSRELNFNVQLSHRGILTLAHSHHELEALRRWANAIQVNEIDSRMLSPDEIARRVPLLRLDGRYPIHGGFIQERGGTSRHDAVAWGFARAASALGVAIVQQCEVTALDVIGGAVRGVQTTRGPIAAGKVMLAVAGHSSVLAEMAGLRLPIVSMTLQAMASEPPKPCLDAIVLSPVVHMYASQSDWLQGHSGRRRHDGPHRGDRDAASTDRRFRPRSVCARCAHRRRRGKRGCALMLQIACPWCGVRDEDEFRCGSQSHISRPDFDCSDAEWADYLFNRDNPKGVHFERWLHAFGCGRWFNAARHTVTHEILAVYRMGEPKPTLAPARSCEASRNGDPKDRDPA